MTPSQEAREYPSAEQQARDMLERMGVEDAQSFTAGDLIELANLIADRKARQQDALDARRYLVLRDLFDAYHDGQYPGFHFKCTVILQPDNGTATVDAICDAAIAKGASHE